MAFKMKSGNKVSFKNMGSSPAKQGYNTELEGADASVGENFKKAQTKKLELANALEEEKRAAANTPEGIEKGKQSEYEKKGAYSDKNRKGNTLDDLKKENVRKEELSREDDGIEGNEGKMYEGDADTDYASDALAYKSNARRKDDNKTRNLKTKLEDQANKNSSKTNDVTEERKGIMRIFGKTKQYTKAERQADKATNKANRTKDRDAQLSDKIRNEKGTGRSGFGFNIKNALIGGDLASGVSYGANHKNTKKTINKRAKKVKQTAIKKSGDAIRDALKNK